MTVDHDLGYLTSRELSVAMTAGLDQALREHFAHVGRQEDLTFAYWKPSQGARRASSKAAASRRRASY